MRHSPCSLPVFFVLFVYSTCWLFAPYLNIPEFNIGHLVSPAGRSLPHRKLLCIVSWREMIIIWDCGKESVEMRVEKQTKDSRPGKAFFRLTWNSMLLREN